MSLNDDLKNIQKIIEDKAKGYGLNFYDVVFELVDYDQINQIAAYGGFPVRYPHWKWGMEYNKISNSYKYGLSKIYEMVINNDPCYAYLMKGNSELDQKLVMAHVYGHADFFKNNVLFKDTNRKMIDEMGNHSAKIKRYIDLYGKERVESFIDCCLSLENLIDRNSNYYNKKINLLRPKDNKSIILNVDKEYMRDFINPKKIIEQDFIERNKKEYEFIEQKDILLFLIERAPLTDWQIDILDIIREESYYFSPQGMTKIMNEGWASYWHSKILTNNLLSDNEIIEFADKHSSVMNMPINGFNPYKIGIELFRDIEERWNKGQFGKDWIECTDIKEKNNWDKKLNIGLDKIFEVRKTMGDISFIDEFLTEDFCVRNKFFVYKFDKDSGYFYIDSSDFNQIKKMLLFKLTNFGNPIIKIINETGAGELVLFHVWEGMDLQPDFLKETLINLFRIWKKPISLHTKVSGNETTYFYDGKEFSYK